MRLPLIDTFSPSYEVWSYRPPTLEEMNQNGHWGEVKDTLIADINNPVEAAVHISKRVIDNALNNHIERYLKKSPDWKKWQQAMPSRTPQEITRYKNDYKNCKLLKVSQEINKHGHPLSNGQYLFHGGVWPGGEEVRTSQPLSTSMCPQVALRNAELNGKAFDAGRIDLWVMNAMDSETKAYVFKIKGTNLGHEKEVLLQSGAQLTKKSEALIRSDFLAGKYNHPCKNIPIYVIELELS